MLASHKTRPCHVKMTVTDGGNVLGIESTQRHYMFHPSMLQCLGWSLESTLPEAESIKWSSSNTRFSCDTCTQNRSSVCLGSLKITSENFFWDQLANRLFTLTSLFAQAWAKEWNHNVWSAKLPSRCRLYSKRALCQYSPAYYYCCRVPFLSPGTSVCRTYLCMLDRMFFVH